MPRMLDLFAGRLGWAKAFLARGWEATPVDLVEPPNLAELQEQYGEYGIDTGRLGFQKSNVLNLVWEGGAIWDRERGVCICHGPDFICASSPCEHFSVHGMKHFHPNPPYPELGIKLFEHTRSICEASGVPYCMENVRAAQQFVGNAVHHCGSFYLWGSGVPPMMPQGIIKGMTREAFGFREFKGSPNWNRKHIDSLVKFGSKSKERKEATAANATIPPELSACVADYAERLMEQQAELSSGVI